MRKITILLLFAIMAFAFNGQGQIFITELADPNNAAGARFVELYNAGATAVDLSAGYDLQRWTNANLTPQSAVELTGSIPAGGFYVVCANQTTFTATYGFAADQNIGTGGPADGNGDDQLALRDPLDAIIDFFGVVGEDGSNTCHDFEDGRAERIASVVAGNTTWDESEWNVWSDYSTASGCTNHNSNDPQDAPDDFDPGAWIGASVGTAPVISNISTDPQSGFTSTTTVSISADITDDGTISSAYLEWGTATGVLTNTISMEEDETPTYVTETDIPAQAVGTTVFYKIYAEDNDMELAETAELSYSVLYPATTFLSYNQPYDTDLGSCYVYDVSGPTKTWEYGSYGANGYANANGFGSTETETDWLILPAINFDSYTNERMTFDTWYRFGTEDVDNYLKLYYSPDYPGFGDPTTFTWNELSFAISANEEEWASSGTLDLSGITGTNVYIGFKYNYQNGSYRWWQVDNIAIYEATPVDVTFQVNMEEQSPSANGIHVAGSFNGWDPAVTEMLDPEMDGTYEVTVSLISGLTYEFKYINGNAWGTNGVDQEIVPVECELPGTGNRYEIVGETDYAIPAVCYGSCNDCGTPQFDITFFVDMQNEVVSGDGVYLAGSFTDWATDAVPMSATGTIWSVTVPADELSNHQYKFVNGDPNIDGIWENFDEPCLPVPWGNREVYVAQENLTLDLVCFNSCDACPIADFVMINEVDADTPGDDSQEFIELYDGGIGNTSLNGLVVVLYNGSDDQSYSPAIDLDGFTTNVDGYFVIGSTGMGTDIELDPGTYGWLQNGADAVALHIGNDSDYPNDTPVSDVNLIDALVYDTNDGDDSGLVDVLTPGQPQINEGGRGNSSDNSNQRIPNGSGGLRVTTTYDQSPPTTGAVNVGLYTDWTGAIDNDWSNDGNWSNIVPDATLEVLIPVTANDPYIIENNKGTSYFAFCMSLDIQAGASLTIAANSNLTVSGTLVNDGNLTLESGDSYAATLLNNTPGVSADIQRGYSFDMQDWHLVSSPITNATAGVFDGFYLQGYVEADNTNAMNGYYEITELGDALNPFEGYAFFPGDGSPDKVTFSGIMNEGLFDASLTANNAYGWNLLGNPYPCSIDWDLVTIPTNMSNEAHFIDAFFGNDISIVQGVPGDNYIPPMQGFFVSATAPVTFSVDNHVKTHNGSQQYYKSEIDELLKLKASGDNFYDKTTIHFNENAGVEHDGIYDAHKRLSLSNLELPQIFSITPAGKYLGINGLPATELVAVGFKAGQSGEFTIDAVETGDFSTVILKDEFTGIETDLLNDSYTFNYNTNDVDHRFNLHFAPLAVAENATDLFSVYAYGDEIIVNSKSVLNNAQVSVYNIMGQEIASDKLNGTVSKLKVDGNAVYIVKVISENGAISKKVYIK